MSVVAIVLRSSLFIIALRYNNKHNNYALYMYSVTLNKPLSNLTRGIYEEKIEPKLESLITSSRPITFIAPGIITKTLDQILLDLADLFEHEQGEYDLPVEKFVSIKFTKMRDICTIAIGRRNNPIVIQDVIAIEPQVIADKLRDMAKQLSVSDTITNELQYINNVSASTYRSNIITNTKQQDYSSELIQEMRELKSIMNKQIQLLSEIKKLIEETINKLTMSTRIDAEDDINDNMISDNVNDVYVDVTDINPEDLIDR